MAYLKIDNVRIAGFSACVPAKIIENSESDLFSSQKELEQYIETTGVQRRHVVDVNTCSSDLCYFSAEKLIEELKWDKSEIECLIFVSQTGDYIYPATACLLQARLNLSTDCMCFDINLSCPGWVYGLSTISSLISAGNLKKALLLVGETVTKTRSQYDRVNLISGDAGTATAVIYDENASPLCFDLHTDGKDFESVLIPDGGFRNPFSKDSLELRTCDDGVIRNRIQTHMDGANILSFAITMGPRSIKSLLTRYEIDKESIDFFVLHQANLLINQIIQKKLKLDSHKCINNITNFGNTSSTAIPLAMVCQLRDVMQYKKYIACAFGGGLSWGSVCFELKDIVCPELIVLP